jgi:hypothetical protein
MKQHATHILILLAGVVLASCVEPYQPTLSEHHQDILVIEADIDATAHIASVTLTHAMSLDDTLGAVAETGAQITVEEQAGSSYPLSEIKAGRYEATGLSIDLNKQYRLTVKTKAGRTYQSAYVTVQQTPAIDSISWKPNTDGITIYANTHGNPALNSTRYYQWTFSETWAYTSKYNSTNLFVDGNTPPRPLDQYVYYCWKTVSSQQILIGTSKNLVEDAVREFPLTAIPKGSYELSRKFSILVRQRSLSEEGYNYWLQLQKTTQNVGGLFDPLPAQVAGNFTCLTDPGEPVLGFFSASTADEKRIYIKVGDLPRYLQASAPYPFFCKIDSMEIYELTQYRGELWLIGGYDYTIAGPTGYTYAPRECIDCTLQGGVTQEPDFWE